MEIKGILSSSGEIQTEKIEIKKSSDIKIKGQVQEVKASSIKILGVEVFINQSTILKDDLENDQGFNLTNLNENDWVEIKAFTNDSGNIIAALLEREEAEDN